jgi:hypothetical protein
VWAFVRAMRSPRLAELHGDVFVLGCGGRGTVELAAHRGDFPVSQLRF